MTPLAPQPQFDRVGGMDADSRPFMVPKEKWRYTLNLRTMYGMSQVPPKKAWFTPVSGALLELAHLPNVDTDYGFWLGLARTQAWQLTPTASVALSGTLAYSGVFSRWSTCMYNNRLFFVNPDNPVRYTDGATVQNLAMHRFAHAVANGFDFIGSGPLTAHPAWDSNPDGTVSVVGDLNTPVDWTAGQYYRVYTTARRGYFAVGALVQYNVVMSSVLELGCAGIVVESQDDYVVVKATNSVDDVPNTWDGKIGWLYTVEMDIPRARYVAILYDHVVVGAPIYKGEYRPNAVMWSHLRDFADWEPRIGSEADSYDCTFFQRNDSVIDGVTGLQMYKARSLSGIHETLLIFTSSCIYSMSYTGLPRIVHVVPLIKDHGNGLQYATAALDDAVVWCDVNAMDFFAYRGQGPESFGQGINSYFFTDLNPDSDLAQRTYAYVDRLNSEVVWVYVSVASTGSYDKAIAFNYQTKTWGVRDAPALACFTRVQRRAKAVSELVGTCASLTGTCGTIERGSDTASLLWGDNNGQVLRDATTSDATFTPSTAVVAETGDLLYGSAQKVKEVSSITINATAANSDFATTGIYVDVSVREHVDDAVVFVQVGTWLPSLATRMLTFTPKAGKVLRYRFRVVSPSTLLGFVWSGFEDNVRGSDAAR